VEARLGPVSLQLSETHINVLREFADRIANPNGAV
jgi:hypothetical protein